MKHGGDVYSHGILEGKKILDYSSNINPLPISKEFSSRIKEALEMVILYPDVKYRTLKDDIIQYLKKSESYFLKFEDESENSTELSEGKYIQGSFLDEEYSAPKMTLEKLKPTSEVRELKVTSDYLKGITRENILVGNGASEILDLIISSLKSITIVVPSFVEYEDFSKKYKVSINYSYLNQGMEYDYEDILLKLENTEALIIGNPNNPNGCIIDADKFMRILDMCEKLNKLVIIDEAFIEFVLDYDKSIIQYIDKYKCIVIVRAITKFFGMPGIRFGYGITRNEKLMHYFSNTQNPWSVNCFAELAVKYALKDAVFIDKSKAWINTERKYMYNMLSNISFIEKVYISYGNYFLCKLKYISSGKLYDHMLNHGILIRNCDNYVGLDDSYVRLAIKDRSSNEVLLKTLEVIAENI
ncbi:histidinol-phosphate transaminase [Clostridium sp.]|uniref:pyridoxal phosphate-dependent aminotransferase n=1 Tax=Clostridium sp. TaxID=1506 RepID=UPI002FCB7C6A